ncbi:MAG: acyltransferase family protein [Candidatus Binataceae bacterium]
MRSDRHTYIPAFDGLRGLAILPVILLHVGVTTLPNGGLLYELSRGWYGVDLFFVLSGFLITWILTGEIESTGTLDLGRFYKRRFLRLAPAYLSMLVAVLAGAAIFERSALAKVPAVAPALLTYTYNYQIALGGPHFDVIVVVWSLCIEEQFYLTWPWILRGLGRRRALWFCLAAIAALSLYRSGLYLAMNWGHLTHPSPASSIWIYFATDTRIGAIFMGCAAALSLRHRRTRKLWESVNDRCFFPLAALFLVGLGVAVVTGGRPSSGSFRSATLGYTLVGFTTAILITAIFLQPSSLVARALSWKPLVSLGTVSYGVYLFHPAIAWLLLHFARIAGVTIALRPALEFSLASVLVLALTWSFAVIHYRYVERWFLSLRKPVAGAPQLSRDKSAESPGSKRVEAADARQLTMQ